MPNKLSHYDGAGRARMVDVSAKSPTRREAEASAFVLLSPRALEALPRNPKGDPLEVARIAGILAAKRTSELIPMCHSLPLSHVDVEMRLCETGVAITTKVITTAQTGVEMEALVAASISALTIFDMLKGVDKNIEIREVVLLRKSGGKSGEYRRGGDRGGDLTKSNRSGDLTKLVHDGDPGEEFSKTLRNGGRGGDVTKVRRGGNRRAQK